MLQRVTDERIRPSFEIGWNALVVSMAIWNRQFELALAASASFALRGDVRAKPSRRTRSWSYDLSRPQLRAFAHYRTA